MSDLFHPNSDYSILSRRWSETPSTRRMSVRRLKMRWHMPAPKRSELNMAMVRQQLPNADNFTREAGDTLLVFHRKGSQFSNTGRYLDSASRNHITADGYSQGDRRLSLTATPHCCRAARAGVSQGQGVPIRLGAQLSPRLRAAPRCGIALTALTCHYAHKCSTQLIHGPGAPCSINVETSEES